MSKLKKILDKVKRLLVITYEQRQRNKSIKRKIRQNKVSKLSKHEKKEIKKMWKPFKTKINFRFFEYYYSLTGNRDPRFIPDNLFYSYIDMYFNNREMQKGIDNKNYYDLYFPEINKPETIIRNIDGVFLDQDYKNVVINDSIILDIFNKNDFLIKPSINSQGGERIVFKTDITMPELIDYMKKNTNFIIQKIQKQAENISKIHENSLNTIRIITLLFKNEVYVLSSVLRVGLDNKKVDNASSGGIVIGIKKDGTLKKDGYQIKESKKFTSHPNTNIVFDNYKIEGYHKLIELVKISANKFPHFKMISWDFALDEENSPVFIEFNLKYGQLDFHQLTNGPLFGSLTEAVLEEVFCKNK